MEEKEFVIPRQDEYALTTRDNPFHPIEEYEQWLRYDEDHGYYTNNYLARVAGTSEALSDYENVRAVNTAIDEILRFDFMGIYKKIKL